MGKFFARLRGLFSFVSNVSTLWGWVSGLVPMAGVISWFVGERQGMTPAGAILLAVIVMVVLLLAIYLALLIADRLRLPKKKLQHVYAATQRLYETVVSANNEEHVTLLAILFEEWGALVSKWLAANFGMAARARFRMHTVPQHGTFVRWTHSNSPEVCSTFDAMSIGLTQQIASLKEMIETDTWDKMSVRKGMTMEDEKRFDELLRAMVHGEPPNVRVPIAKKSASAAQASDAEQSACSNDTQTPPDTSEGASH